jgi:LAS superfamily LD-carboxypeptidase LdcB
MTRPPESGSGRAATGAFKAALAGAILLVSACDGADRENVTDRLPRTPPPLAGAPTTPGVLPSIVDMEGDCGRASAFRAQALQNAASSQTMEWSPFGRPEYGWKTYAPRIGQEIGTLCPPDSPGFAQALARWQAQRNLPADGQLKPEVFELMKVSWHRARPYVSLRGDGVCPDPPPERVMATARPEEGYSGKVIQLRPAALDSLRKMVADARAQVPEIARDPVMLTVFSGYRSPAYDAERCARDGNCNGITRASCSVHRTGLAVDLVVGAAPGHSVDSTADPNRLHMSQTPAYRWLVANAHRYGWVNYAFEPWHWEWTGEPIEVAPEGYRLAPGRARGDQSAALRR